MEEPVEPSSVLAGSSGGSNTNNLPHLVSSLRKLLSRQMLVGVNDGRFFLGAFYCIDKQRNIILQDAVEYRSTRRSSPAPMEQRCLGLILIPSTCRCCKVFRGCNNGIDGRVDDIPPERHALVTSFTNDGGKRIHHLPFSDPSFPLQHPWYHLRICKRTILSEEEVFLLLVDAVGWRPEGGEASEEAGFVKTSV
ncbi:hypothetical protein NE237_001964 [Protea cynaroides]|uniref:Sm domain-containing protein n=1 Tax=Protea cynaroides TaxID=273540 RepID=A0A9Q0QYL8_9MAGN|nr:hypothetical protein NE237_001964 [Protea cynaroides]